MSEVRHAAQTLFLVLLAILCVSEARSADIEARNVTISVSLESAATPNSTIWVAVHQMIRPGWHTYWENPGMAGLPLKIDWSLPDGVTAGSIRWPVPERFAAGGIIGYGYRDQATFLVPLTVRKVSAQQRQIADMKLSWLVCAEMCIPEDAQVQLALGRASGSPGLFAKARGALPRVISGEVSATYDDRTLKLSIRDPDIVKSIFGAVQFFPGAGGIIDDTTSPEISHCRKRADPDGRTPCSSPTHLKGHRYSSPDRGAGIRDRGRCKACLSSSNGRSRTGI